MDKVTYKKIEFGIEILDEKSEKFLGESIDLTLWDNLIMSIFKYDVFAPKGNRELILEKARSQMTELLAFLISIPKDKGNAFVDYLLKKGSWINNIAGVLLANMRGIRLDDATKIYDYLLYETKNIDESIKGLGTGTRWSKYVLESIISIYGIEVVEKKSLLCKRKISLVFPQGFYERVADEAKLIPQRVLKKKKEVISADDWNKFVDWWVNNDYESTKNNDFLFGAYTLFSYNEEVQNGGHGQFFTNKSDWDFDKLAELFEPLLPKKLYANYLKAVTHFKDLNEDYEEYDNNYDDDQVNNVLEKIACKIIKLL